MSLVYVVILIVLLVLIYHFRPTSADDPVIPDKPGDCDALPKPLCASSTANGDDAEPSCVNKRWVCSFYNLGTTRVPALPFANYGQQFGGHDTCMKYPNHLLTSYQEYDNEAPGFYTNMACGWGTFTNDGETYFADVGVSSPDTKIISGFRLQPHDYLQKDDQFLIFNDIDAARTLGKSYEFSPNVKTLEECKDECMKVYKYTDSTGKVVTVNGCFGFVFVDDIDKQCNIYKINGETDLNNKEKHLRDPSYTMVVPDDDETPA